MFSKLDGFSKNFILVFLGTSLVNVFSLIYQLLIAHRINPADFAAFSSLLSIFTIFSAPMVTIQSGVAKYTSEFNAYKEADKIKIFLSDLLLKTFFVALVVAVVTFFVSSHLIHKLNIPSLASVYILTTMLFLSFMLPIFTGAVQGLELFKWLTFISVISGALKLVLAFLFIAMGFNIAGALGAFLASMVMIITMSCFPLSKYLSLGFYKAKIDYQKFLLYLFPVATSYFCFSILTTSDIILVRYFFTPEESGIYSLAQIVGKILLFLPGAISVVMFPKTSGLHAKSMDTAPTLRKSILYGAGLCTIACIGYNIYPNLALKILTGKVLTDSILLGRLFSISMSFFALLFIMINYFLSKKDFRFIKYLAILTALQVAAITVFHQNLIQVQIVLCITAALLFIAHLKLSYTK